MKKVPCLPGFLNIFPNYKHQNRKDGFGCSSLSPKSMGPIEHGQPGLPMALNLENFHQGNKVFPYMVDGKGDPLPIFYEVQKMMYLEKEPYRHQHDFIVKHPELLNRIKLPKKKVNAPLYSVWRTGDEKEIHISYIESRQFYCYFYEKLALASDDFWKILDMGLNGMNLQICGYDAYQPTASIVIHYSDPSRPFGHELVLYCLLTCDSSAYPWRLYQTFDIPAK